MPALHRPADIAQIRQGMNEEAAQWQCAQPANLASLATLQHEQSLSYSCDVFGLGIIFVH